MTTTKHRSRNIPWLSAVRFHKEIAARAENSFFSLNGRDAKSERWTSLTDFEPDNLAGPWELDPEKMVSAPFKLATEQGTHDSLFLGGPRLTRLPHPRPRRPGNTQQRDRKNQKELQPVTVTSQIGFHRIPTCKQRAEVIFFAFKIRVRRYRNWK